jgi:phospholipid/cholesterol/gamma-HCH transport system ATP-binding protein
MADHSAIIRMNDVHKAFGALVVLDGVSLEIRRGETTVIIGPSGCGKSVLLKHIVGLLKPDRGDVYFNDIQISSMRESQLMDARKKMGFLFQGGALFDSMTVEENILFPLRHHGLGTPSERREQCRHVLAMVGLQGLQSRYPEELSGGQRKRVALARAIVMDPELILYDEPTTGLDPIRSDLINELILKLQEAMGATSLVVTHDLASARKVGDRILMLHEGHFIADVTPEQLDHVSHEAAQRFVQGQACPEELAELRNHHSELHKESIL